jgi:septum formation protein
MDKAGAYAIQGKAAKYIRSINGDYYTIVGLPIGKVIKSLKKLKALS